jgi:hypothetical protein
MNAPARITVGDERTLLESMLDHNRAALIETVRGLSEEQARRRLVASATTPIGLIKHAAAGERIWFQHYLSGLPESECDGYARRGEGSFAVSDDETLSDVIAEFERASRRSRSIAEQYDLEHTVATSPRRHRQLPFHLLARDRGLRSSRRPRRHSC